MRLAYLLTLALAGAAITACGGDDDGGPDAGGTPDGGASAACSADMFDKYGVDAFLAVNDSIIEKSVAAPTSALGNSFQMLAAQDADRVQEFTTNLASFLVFVYGGPNNYTGPDMEEAHAGLGITSEQYDYFVANVIVPALVDNGVATADIENCFAPPVTDPGFKATIVGQ